MENRFVKYSPLKKRMTVKIRDPKKRSMHRIFIHTDRLINGVNKVSSQTITSLRRISHYLLRISHYLLSEYH